MEFIKELLSHISAENVVRGGYIIMAIIVFAETGLLAGFFLPGDSMLVTAGVFAARGDLNIYTLIALLTVCAIIGDAVGYAIGRQAGKALFSRPDSRFFKKKYLDETHAFYERHGGKTIIFARFVPIVRTFAPTIAGVAAMPYSRFVIFNVFGGFFWVFSMTMLGYLLGSFVPDIDKNIDKVIIVIILISILPIVWKAVQERFFKPKVVPVVEASNQNFEQPKSAAEPPEQVR
ncbi:MAG: VTT domain-containing protein [Rhizobacter sp.]|nr:VTT domain-containing protein [Chlorobiales bacterium]